MLALIAPQLNLMDVARLEQEGFETHEVCVFRGLTMVVGLLGLADAQAQSPLSGDVGVWGGLVHSDTPVAPAVGLSTALRWKGAISLRLRGAFLPGQEQSGLLQPTRRTQQTSVHGLGDLAVLFEPILLDVFGYKPRIHMGIGMGIVRTIDDLESSRPQDDDPYAFLASRQWHPTASWTVGLSGPITRHIAVSFDVSSVYFVEVFPTSTDLKSPIVTGVSLLFRPTPKEDPVDD